MAPNCLTFVINGLCCGWCWSPCREEDEDDFEEIQLEPPPRVYYRGRCPRPPEVVLDHLPVHRPPICDCRRPRNIPLIIEPCNVHRPVVQQPRGQRGLSDGEVTRGQGASRTRGSRRDDPRRHTLGSGNQHLYVNPQHHGRQDLEMRLQAKLFNK